MSPDLPRIPSGRRKPPAALSSLAALAIVLLVVLYLLRPVFHGFAMIFYTAPLVWIVPFLIFVGGAGYVVWRTRMQLREDKTVRKPDSRLWVIDESGVWKNRAAIWGQAARKLMIVGGIAFATFVIAGLVNAPLSQQALFKHTRYVSIKELPTNGAVRLVPKEVAERVANSGFNSPTERLSDFHLVRRADGKLQWTALRTPHGVYRALTQQSAGMLTLNASSSSRDTKLVDAKFETAPGMYLTDNLTWKLLKKHFFVELDDPIAVTDQSGKPLIAVPYMKYKGFLIRHPVFGGVFVIHPDGKIEDLKPEQARKRPELVRSGRIYPEKLARRRQEVYAYKNGLWNKWFLHEDQTNISHTETNPQPYLLDFGERGLKYVTAAEPYGRAFAVNSIFLTDAITGTTTLWKPARNAELTGNRRVLETVRSLSIPGIVFAETGASGSNDRGGFRVVEPRPVSINGRLLFMTSIVPDNANNVSKTVFVDAASNKVTAIFNNDTDSNADSKIAAYLDGSGPAGATATPAIGEGGDEANDPVSAATGSTGAGKPSKRNLQQRIDDLVQRQRDLIKELEDLRDDVR